MSKIFLLTLGLALIPIIAVMSLARMGADGAYWLISSHNAYTSGGMYVQQPDEGQRHMMHGFDQSMSFLWWSDAWLYFRTVEAFNADFYSLYLYRMRVGSRQRECVGRKLALLGADPLSDFTPAPGSEWVAFATPEGEPNRVYVSRNDCVNPTRVFDSQTDVVNSLFWSPDGEWLYIHTHHESVNRSHLYRVHTDGTGFALLTETHAERYQTDKSWLWSPDGEWVLLRACGSIDIYSYPSCSLYTVRADGGEQGEIVTNVNSGIIGYSYWAPDSQSIAYTGISEETSGFSVLHAGLDGTTIENLTQLPGQHRLLQFAPQGEWILFISSEADTEVIRRIRPSESDPPVILDIIEGHESLQAVMLIDDWLFVTEWGNNDASSAHLYRVRLDGTEMQPIVTGEFVPNRWHLSPDGQSLLTTYGDGSASQARLFRVNVDGSQPENIPMESYYEPRAVSPLINLPWRAGFLLLTGLVMLALGMSFRVILTKVPQLFDVE